MRGPCPGPALPYSPGEVLVRDRSSGGLACPHSEGWWGLTGLRTSSVRTSHPHAAQGGDFVLSSIKSTRNKERRQRYLQVSQRWRAAGSEAIPHASCTTSILGSQLRHAAGCAR